MLLSTLMQEPIIFISLYLFNIKQEMAILQQLSYNRYSAYTYIYIYTQVFRRRYIYDEREIYVRAGILCHIYDLLFVLFELMQGNSKSWQQMTHKWGVNWVLNSPNALQPPFSIRLTSLSGKKTLTANSVIPKNWQPNATYKSNVNYQ